MQYLISVLHDQPSRAGFWIIEALDLDMALKLGVDGSRACKRKLEVRPFLSD